jgi:hypothetical protein
MSRNLQDFKISRLFNHDYLSLDTNQVSFEEFKNLLVTPTVPDRIELGGSYIASKVDSKETISKCSEKVKDVLLNWEKEGVGNDYCQHLPFLKTKREVISEYTVEKNEDFLFVSRLERSLKKLTDGFFSFRGASPSSFYFLLGRELVSYFLFNQKFFGLSRILVLDRESLSYPKNLVYKIEKEKMSGNLFSLLGKVGPEKSINIPLSDVTKQMVPSFRNESQLSYLVFTFDNLKKNFSSFEEVKEAASVIYNEV